MGSTVRVDIDKFEADLAAAIDAADAARERMHAAMVESQSADDHVERLRSFMASLSRYAADDTSGENPAVAEALRASRPLAGMPAKTAFKAFLPGHEGRTVKLGDLHAEMVGMGFQGTENALSVAIADLVRQGLVTRGDKRGYYLLGPAKDTDDPEREEWSLI